MVNMTFLLSPLAPDCLRVWPAQLRVERVVLNCRAAPRVTALAAVAQARGQHPRVVVVLLQLPAMGRVDPQASPGLDCSLFSHSSLREKVKNWAQSVFSPIFSGFLPRGSSAWAAVAVSRVVCACVRTVVNAALSPAVVCADALLFGPLSLSRFWFASDAEKHNTNEEIYKKFEKPNYFWQRL